MMQQGTPEHENIPSSCDIFALGHAIVDVEFSVSFEFLASLGYQPGDRRLIPEGTFQILHAALQAPGAEATWQSQSGGGSAANSIVTAQRLGAQCYFASKLAKDAAGWFYQQTLQQEGVDVPDTPLAEGISGHCLVLITPDGNRTMLLHLGVTDALDMSYVDLEALSRARCLLLESYLITHPTARQTVAETRSAARKAQVPIAVSLSDPDIISHFRRELEDWFTPPVDYLFGNELEALTWTDSTDLDKAVKALRDLAQTVVITRGAQGVRVVSSQEDVTLPAPEVTPVSTLGAGDTFAGAFLYADLIEALPLAEAARLACQCAARHVEFSGPRLSREQLINVKTRFDKA